ncbi:MAG: hypothetical protein AB7K52_12045 [Phycisphaerales bacterium]
MRVFLDDEPVAVTDPSVGAAVAAARSAAWARGRVVVEVKLDGRDLAEEELGASGPAGGAELRMLSAEPGALVAYSLKEVAGSLPNLRAAQTEAAERLQVGEFGPALSRLGEALAVWESLRRVVDEGPRLLGLEASTVPSGNGEGTIGDEVARLAGILSGLQAALQNQDWSSLADLLEGDLDEAADGWERALAALAERVARSESPRHRGDAG